MPDSVIEVWGYNNTALTSVVIVEPGGTVHTLKALDIMSHWPLYTSHSQLLSCKLLICLFCNV